MDGNRTRLPCHTGAVHPPVAFLDRTYDDVLALTRAARDYVAGARASHGGASVKGLTASLESMRLTTRVVQVMAWCLAQKAIFAGELDRDPATVERFALTGRNVCLGGMEAAEDESLPERLRALLAQSRALYLRVLHLDELLHRDVGARA
jgi:regulator of CtrA degradation